MPQTLLWSFSGRWWLIYACCSSRVWEGAWKFCFPLCCCEGLPFLHQLVLISMWVSPGEFAALVSSPPTISTTCQQVANMASRLQSSRVTTVTMLLSASLFYCVKAIISIRSSACFWIKGFNTFTAKLIHISNKEFSFFVLLNLSDNGIRCFSNLDLYLAMVIFFVAGKGNYD